MILDRIHEPFCYEAEQKVNENHSLTNRKLNKKFVYLLFFPRVYELRANKK